MNVVDLMRLQPDTEHPHGLSDREYDALFTTDKPVIFAYHGYPWLIHRLTYRRHGHDNLHVRGYKEEGTVTTPFDMVVLNDMDRFHLVMDVIDRVPRSRRQRRARPPAHGRRAHPARRVHARVRRGHARGARLDVAVTRSTDARARRERRVEQPQAAGARGSTTRSKPRTTSNAGTPTADDDRRRRRCSTRCRRSTRSATGSCTAAREFRERGAHRRRRSSARCSRCRRSRRCTSRARSPASACCARLYPDLPQVACFDTAFHATLARGGVDVRAPAGVARPVGPAALRLPRPVARVRVAPRAPSSSVASTIPICAS